MMDAEERELFAKSLRQAAAGASGPALDAALDDLGWPDALAADPRAAVPLLFEAQGASASTSSALDRVVLAALDVAPGGGVVLPAAGRWDPPGTLAGQGLAVQGLATAGLAAGDRAVVVAPSSEGFVAAVVDPGDLDVREIEGIDPRLGLVAVAGETVPVAATRPAAWVEALAAGQRALAHELVGASRAMLGLARDHAVERIQFGRPIAAFQAVRHRLADALVAVESTDAALAAAWDDPAPLTAALAKALAGRAATTVARHAQQVLAGIGFTTEHDLHAYVRRVLVLDRLLGDAGSLTRRLGEDLLADRHLPALLPL
jgi:Acyl-CoA dehydrogenase, C-terminal domain